MAALLAPCDWPTARQKDRLLHQVSLKMARLEPGTGGVATRCQAPFVSVSARATSPGRPGLAISPTAMQKLVDVQCTPVSAADRGTLTAVSRFQECPFHRSDSVTFRLRPCHMPAATQLFARAHETLKSVPAVMPAGSPRCVTRQRCPFHCSASGPNCFREFASPPTAVQSFALGQVTETRNASLAFGAGIVWIVQEPPFHRSANGAWPCRVASRPTAMHNFARGQETASSAA